MFSVTRTETKLIMEEKSAGVVRRYPSGECPYKVGDEIVFTSRFIPWMKDEKPVPFAKATITSVRPGTIGSFRKDDRQAKHDGFANANTWHAHLNQFYRGIKDDDSAVHLSFRVIEIDKQAGQKSR